MRQVLEQAATQLIPPLMVALGGLLCALVAYATSYFRNKTKNAKIQEALDRFDLVAEDAVKDAEQRIIRAIKPGDDLGTVLLSAKAAAVESITSHYGDKGISELKKVLGWDDIQKNISTKIEAKVHDLKAQKTQGSQAVPPPLPPVV